VPAHSFDSSTAREEIFKIFNFAPSFTLRETRLFKKPNKRFPPASNASFEIFWMKLPGTIIEEHALRRLAVLGIKGKLECINYTNMCAGNQLMCEICKSVEAVIIVITHRFTCKITSSLFRVGMREETKIRRTIQPSMNTSRF
jgi:hypothetical protein